MSNFDYNLLTHADMDEAQDQIWDELSKVEIFNLPGVYEIFVEEYNNAILDAAREIYHERCEQQETRV